MLAMLDVHQAMDLSMGSWISSWWVSKTHQRTVWTLSGDPSAMRFAACMRLWHGTGLLESPTYGQLMIKMASGTEVGTHMVIGLARAKGMSEG
jgi:hypothetical protein